MALAKYRLASVLELRLRVKERAGREVGIKRSALLDAEAELERRAQAIASCRLQIESFREEMFECVSRGIESTRLAGYRTYLADLKRTEEALIESHSEQRAAVARAENELDEAILALNEASKQSKILEKHRQSWEQRVQRDLKQREQKQNEEVGALLYERHRRLLNP